jgi:hypothetical protein
MSVPGSITALVERLRGGDQEAARLLWQRYYPRLVALARRKLQGASRRVAHEEKSLPVMDGPPRCGGTSGRAPRVASHSHPAEGAAGCPTSNDDIWQT